MRYGLLYHFVVHHLGLSHSLQQTLKALYVQEGSTIGDLYGMPSRRPPKIVGVASECQGSQKF